MATPEHALTPEEAAAGSDRRLVEAMFAAIDVNLVRQPTLTERERRDGYVAYDTDNLLPQRLNKLANTSPTHAAILDATSKAIAGYDVALLAGTEPLGSVVVNPRGETLRQLVKKVAVDLARYNGFALQITPSKTLDRIAGIYHQDFSTVRAMHPQHEEQGIEEGNQVRTYQISNDWERYLRGRGKDKTTFKPIKLRAYRGPESLRPPKGEQPAPLIYYYASYSPGEGYYPLPNYYGGLDYIQLEMEIGVFHLKSVQNGFSPSLYVRWEHDPGEKMRGKVRDMFIENYMGANKAQRAMFGFGQLAPEVTPLQMAGNADIYNAIAEIATQKIISAHRLPSPVLAGLPGAGSLGGNSSEILTASELWQSAQIQPRQEELADALLPLLRQMQHYQSATEMVIEDTQPLQFRVPFDQLRDYMTTEEIREHAGLPIQPEAGTLPQRMGRQLTLDLKPATDD